MFVDSGDAIDCAALEPGAGAVEQLPLLVLALRDQQGENLVGAGLCGEGAGQFLRLGKQLRIGDRLAELDQGEGVGQAVFEQVFAEALENRLERQGRGGAEKDCLGVLGHGVDGQQVEDGEGVVRREVGALARVAGVDGQRCQHLDNLGADQGWMMGAGGWFGHGWLWRSAPGMGGWV